MRDLRNLIIQAYNDDDAIIKRQQEQMQQQINMKQLMLLDSDIKIRGMQNVVIERKLRRIMWRLKAWETVKNIFTPKR